MIENIRKYTGLIIVVIVVLIFGFILMDTNGVFRQNAARGGDIIRVEGRTYGLGEFNRLSRDSLGIIEGISQLTQRSRGFDFKAYELSTFAQTLIGNVNSPEVALQNFFASRVVLRDAFEQFGIHPSDSEIDDYIKELAIFQAPPPIGSPPGTTSGEFDQQAFNNFIDRGIKESELRDLIRDVIATDKLREVIGNGLTVDRDFAKATAIVNAQQVEVAASSIEIESFREGIEPSEEDLKKFWEEVKDGYMTEKRIKVSYFIAAPDLPEETKEEETTEEDAEKTEEEKKAEAEAQATEDAAKAEAEKELAKAIDSFVTILTDEEGENFDQQVEEGGWELVSTDWFTRSDVPEALKIQPRATSIGQSVVNELFGLATGPDELAPFSKAMAVGENQWLLARLDELEEPRVKTFEEAREEIEKRYIDEKADEVLKEHVAGKIEAIRKGLDDGKSFVDAAKEVELDATELGPFGPTDTLTDGFLASDLFTPASTVNPGELAEPIYTDKQAIILFVKNRQIVRDDNRGAQIDANANRLAQTNSRLAFDAWLHQRLKAAEVIDLTKS
ncbi:MAG: SurA N-terminal domain-containing protein [Verrucomicrobiota bacterium]